MTSKGLAVVVAAAGLGLAVAVQAADAPKAAPDGAALYTSKCASCHGKDGKGDAKKAKMFKVDEAAVNLVDDATLAKADADLVKVVTDGSASKKMPAFGKKLKADQIAAVVAHVRSLKAAAPAAAAPAAAAPAPASAAAPAPAKK